jgi:hypothetical protein
VQPDVFIKGYNFNKDDLGFGSFGQGVSKGKTQHVVIGFTNSSD